MVAAARVLTAVNDGGWMDGAVCGWKSVFGCKLARAGRTFEHRHGGGDETTSSVGSRPTHP